MTVAPRIEPVDVDLMLDRAVAGLPRWRRGRTRRELAAYVEDAFADFLEQGVDAVDALAQLQLRFGDPDAVSRDFHALPPPHWLRPLRRAAAPAFTVALGVVIGLALVQVRARDQAGAGLTITPGGNAPVLQARGLVPLPSQLELLHVREVNALAAPPDAAGAQTDYRVAARLGVARDDVQVLEPSVPAFTPDWLPDGYTPGRSQLFLTASSTSQLFTDAADRPGIVVEVLRPDRSTVFQVKERHVFPVTVASQPGFYIDGEWEVRGPSNEQAAPSTWRTDRSHSLLFSHDGLLVLVAGPADVLDPETLMRIAASVR